MLIQFFSLRESIDETTNEYKKIEIVISRYNESLDWLKDSIFSEFPLIIYNKGENNTYFKPNNLKYEENIENVGVSVHTFFYYIIQNYNNLPDIIIFLPGSCMDPHKKNMTLKTIELVKKSQDTVFIQDKKLIDTLGIVDYNYTADYYTVDNIENREKNSDNNLIPCKIRPYGKWYESIFKESVNNQKYVVYKGIFAVSKNHILQKDKTYYENLIQYVDKNKNEESAHYFERAFVTVFQPIPDSCIYKIEL